MALGGSEKLVKDVQMVKDTDGRLVVVGINGAAIGGGGGGAVDTELPAAAALADSAANPIVPSVGAHPMVFDGTNWNRARAFSRVGSDQESQFLGVGISVDSGGNIRKAVGGGDNLNPAPASGALLAIAAQLFNGSTYDLPRTPVVFKDIASTAITGGTGATVWTPAAGKKFRLMGFMLSLSVAGSIIFGDNAVGTVLFRTPALAAAGVIVVGADMLGNGKLSAAANNVLKLDVTTTGNVAGVVFGTEE